MKRGPYSKGILMKRKILSASAKVFLERGYAGTSSKLVADLVGVSNGSPFFHYGNKEGVLLEFVKRMFSGQFCIAERLTGDATEPLRELYVTAYTLPSTAAYINEGMEKKLAAIFGGYLPKATENDWAALELATSGIMRSFMSAPCTEDYPMAAKLRNYLSCCYKLFEVPRAHYEPFIDQIVRIDLTKTAQDIIDETVRQVDEGYEAAMAGREAPEVVGS